MFLGKVRTASVSATTWGESHAGGGMGLNSFGEFSSRGLQFAAVTPPGSMPPLIHLQSPVGTVPVQTASRAIRLCFLDDLLGNFPAERAPGVVVARILKSGKHTGPPRLVSHSLKRLCFRR